MEHRIRDQETKPIGEKILDGLAIFTTWYQGSLHYVLDQALCIGPEIWSMLLFRTNSEIGSLDFSPITNPYRESVNFSEKRFTNRETCLHPHFTLIYTHMPCCCKIFNRHRLHNHTVCQPVVTDWSNGSSIQTLSLFFPQHFS